MFCIQMSFASTLRKNKPVFGVFYFYFLDLRNMGKGLGIHIKPTTLQYVLRVLPVMESVITPKDAKVKRG